jgi:hypothetical protein
MTGGKMFHVKIELGFEGMMEREDIATALETVIKELRNGDDYGRIRALDGSPCGRWRLD